jgi:hypothetical protein
VSIRTRANGLDETCDYPERSSEIIEMKFTALRIPVVAIGAMCLGWSASTFAGKPSGGGGSTCTTNIPVVPTYNGRATALSITDVSVLTALKLPPVVISDTGELGPTSAETQKEKYLVGLDLPLPPNTSPPALRVRAAILDGLTKSMGNTTTSWAYVAGLDIELNAGAINVIKLTSGTLLAVAGARLDGPGSCPAGSSTGSPIGSPTYGGYGYIEDLILSIMGKQIQIPLATPPNTRIDVPGVAHIVINERYMANGRQVVNALHVTLDPALALVATADIVVSHAEADISGACGVPTTNCPTPCKVKDFVTGGGWVTLPDGSKGTFGFNGGYKPNGLTGHLTYIDHGTGAKVSGTTVNAYGGTGTAREMVFNTCDTNGTAGSCVLKVSDNGEPGGGVDGFNLSYPGGSAAGPTITKGNIQLHQSTCPAAPTPPPPACKGKGCN